MKRNLLIIASLVLGITGLAFAVNKPSTQAVYMDMGTVYDKFHLSKELHEELEEVFKTRKHILDSLYNDLRQLSESIRADKNVKEETLAGFKRLEEEYLYKQKSFEEENRAAVQSCDQKIWKQINEYTEKYGKEMDYDYILGANGQGNIMYGKDRKNITEELLIYINAHYDDKVN